MENQQTYKEEEKKYVSLLNGIQQARSSLFQIPASGLERLDTHGLGAQSQSGRKIKKNH
jgi:hypothetical protein